MEAELKAVCDGLREEIKKIGVKVHDLKLCPDMAKIEEYAGQRSEMRANIILAYRHLEDARMRIGKILQAADDGISMSPKTA